MKLVQESVLKCHISEGHNYSFSLKAFFIISNSFQSFMQFQKFNFPFIIAFDLD